MAILMPFWEDPIFVHHSRSCARPQSHLDICAPHRPLSRRPPHLPTPAVRAPLSVDDEPRPRILIPYERVVGLPARREQPVRLPGRPPSQALPLAEDLWITVALGTCVNGPPSVAGRDGAAVTPGPVCGPSVDAREGVWHMSPTVSLGACHARCRRPPVGAWLDEDIRWTTMWCVSPYG
jgi:hypothetical protein